MCIYSFEFYKDEFLKILIDFILIPWRWVLNAKTVQRQGYFRNLRPFKTIKISYIFTNPRARKEFEVIMFVPSVAERRTFFHSVLESLKTICNFPSYTMCNFPIANILCYRGS